MKTRILVSSAFLAVLFFLASYAITLLNLGAVPSALLLTAILLVVTKVTFGLMDSIFPPPGALSTEDIKSFLKSKIFWLALINFIAAFLEGLFEIQLDEETKIEIIGLNWGNIGQALISLAIIAIRKFDIFKYLV